MTALATTRVSTLEEMGELVRSRPGLDASPAVVAGWYERKAALLGHIATETGGDIESLRLSRLAHTHAVSLLATAQLGREVPRR
jgi:hypothetical protein